jgi:hypothetical protein
VVIKEAALDSPTFRATAVHFGDQIELIERWLDTYVRTASKLTAELNNVQTLVDAYIQASHPPLQLSEAVLDHDYTVLALKRFGEGAREFWNSTIRSMKRAESTVCEPIRAFLQNDLRILKEARKNLDSTQRIFDLAIARYAGQVKSKEPSSLREDAFQLHEARRAYLTASMNFCVMAPQVRLTLDKILVKVVNEQWRDMRVARETSTKALAAWTSDVERVRGWSKEMENGERVFKRELHLARQQVENAAEVAARPSRSSTHTPHRPYRILALHHLQRTSSRQLSLSLGATRQRSRVGCSSAQSLASLLERTGSGDGSSSRTVSSAGSHKARDLAL